jgi:hypothetical protein
METLSLFAKRRAFFWGRRVDRRTQPVSCEEAVLVAQGVSVAGDVWTQGPIAMVKPYPVSDGLTSARRQRHEYQADDDCH